MNKKKITNLIVGTNNPGKLREIKDLLRKNIKVHSPKELNLRSPRECGKTFKENSLIKARFFSKKARMICLADDSGLEIDILDKKPGIYSSRWAGVNNNYNFAIKKVFKKLSMKDKNWKNKKIKARFVCALSVYFPSGKKLSRIGKIEGLISSVKKEKMDLVMIQYLFLIVKKLHLHKCYPRKNLKLIIDQKLLEKLKNFYKFFIFYFVKVKNVINFIFVNLKNTNFSFKLIFFVKNFFIYFKVILVKKIIN